MIKVKKAETLISIIIWIFILAFVILGITNLMIESKIIIDKFERNKNINILKINSSNIIKNINTSNFLEDTIFYIYKNEYTNTFETKTWVTYKYIDRHWVHISDLVNFKWDIYSRVFYIKKESNLFGYNHQIIKASIKRLVRN